MPIEIERVDGGYIARAHRTVDGAEWSTSEPMTVNALVAALFKMGFHQQDIGDAFYQADPDWVEHAEDG